MVTIIIIVIIFQKNAHPFTPGSGAHISSKFSQRRHHAQNIDQPSPCMSHAPYDPPFLNEPYGIDDKVNQGSFIDTTATTSTQKAARSPPYLPPCRRQA